MNRREFQSERLQFYLKGDVAAIEFCAMFFRITQIWDDLHDGDARVEPGTVNAAFEAALIHIPENPFFMQHFNVLQPLIRVGINAWLDSNELLDMGGTNNLARAYMLRDGVGEVLIACMRIVGGYPWMRTHSARARVELINDESFETYCAEVTP